MISAVMRRCTGHGRNKTQCSRLSEGVPLLRNLQISEQHYITTQEGRGASREVSPVGDLPIPRPQSPRYKHDAMHRVVKRCIITRRAGLIHGIVVDNTGLSQYTRAPGGSRPTGDQAFLMSSWHTTYARRNAEEYQEVYRHLESRAFSQD